MASVPCPAPWIREARFQNYALDSPLDRCYITIEREVIMYYKPLPDLDELLHRFDYDPDTGYLTWRNPTFRTCAKGVIDPTAQCHGYRVVGLHGVTYLQHRIIWKWVTGNDPDPDLAMDHIDEDTGNNRWCNLRQTTFSDNASRSSKHVRAVRLVVWQNRYGRWSASRETPHVGGATRDHIGTFDTKAEALSQDVNNIYEKPPLITQVKQATSGRWEARYWDREQKKKIQIGTFDTKEQARACKIPQAP